MQCHLLQPDVGADEMDELVGGDFSQTLETGDFRVGSQIVYSLLALLVAIAIARDEVAFLLAFLQLGVRLGHHLLVLDLGASVAHAEQWSLQHVDMPFLDQVGEELEEEGDDKQAYVHAVDIGIGGHNHLVIAQRVEPILDIKGSLQQVELLVLVHHLLGQSEAIERFSPE